MGGTVGIEAARLEELDYEAVKASGLAFGTAHNVLQRSLTKSKSVNVSNDQTTIHFLAIRQLSHNLKNQKVLEQSRKKVMKTKSVPNNVKYKQHSFERELRELDDGEYMDHAEHELDNDDLDLIHDEEYHAHHDSFHAKLVDDGPPWSFSEKAAYLNENGHAARSLTSDPSAHEAAGIATSDSVGLSTTPPKVAIAKPKKARPNLSLQLTSDISNNALPIGETTSHAPHPHPHKLSLLKTHSHDRHDNEAADAGGVVVNSAGQPLKHPSSPSANVRVSPRGTLYMGKWKVMETGIFPDENHATTRKQHKMMHNHGSMSNGLDRNHTASRGLGASSSHIHHQSSTSSNLNRTGVSMNGSLRRPAAALPAIGGKRDFLEINTLGSGASGVVTEAIHLPSLTIVALKMLPVYNQEKRQHVSRELGVLYKNLAELRLVDDSLYDNGESKDDTPAKAGGLGGVSSPHILSLYNAFVDPKSGMINLVIEYMDGGSLEDLVQQGGCRDEKVLADITYQTIKGLCFLHAHKSVHRDIKPANILCSTSGLIKIGDFGISKALDKTSGFANSFVGTVSYMSPERITGETYSFSSDIWSLGLTILAVAKGRFPLSSSHDHGDDSLSESSSPLHQQVVGGAAGYWAMIKAICDDEPPVAGPFFSEQFNSFIAACLQKEPLMRASAKSLLATEFITNNADSLKLSPSDLHMRRGSRSPDDSVQATVTCSSDAKESPERPEAKNSTGSPSKLTLDVNCLSDGPMVPHAPSPLTTRLTNAAIVRRSTLETTPVFDSPTNLMHKAITQAEQQQHKAATASSLDTGSTKDSNLSGNAIARSTIREDAEEEDFTVIDGAQRALDVINSIRLEHLDRVLDRIAHKLGKVLHGGDGQGCRSTSRDDDDYDDTHERDCTDIHSFDENNHFAAAKNDPLLTGHDSIDSMDKLLQYKTTAEPPSPSTPVLQLPAHKFHKKVSEPTSPQVDEAAAAKPVSSPADAKMVTHKHTPTEENYPATATAALHLRAEHKGSQEEYSVDEKAAAGHHSILKGTSSYNATHMGGGVQAPHPHPHQATALTHIHEDHIMVPSEGGINMMSPEEKKAMFAGYKTRSINGSTAFNSNRSVHFNESDDDDAPRSRLLTVPHYRPSLVPEGDVDAAEGEAGDHDGTSMHPHLPRTSSYFVKSRSQEGGDGEEAKGVTPSSSSSSNINTMAGVVDRAIAVSEAVSQAAADAPPSAPVDYRRMLPKLNTRGLPKWENLARQLHLPLHLVKLAVRSRLGGLMNLEDEDEDEEEDEDEGYEGSDYDDAGMEGMRGRLLSDQESPPSIEQAGAAAAADNNYQQQQQQQHK